MGTNSWYGFFSWWRVSS